MRRLLTVVLVFAAIGLMIGYLLFGRIGGDYVALGELLSPSQGFFDEVSRELRGINHARRNVLLAGGIGAVVGLITVGFRKR